MLEKRPQVIVLAGPNGAGKTTSAPLLLRDTFSVLEYVNADPIAHGLSAFDPSAVAIQAGRVMLDRLHELANRQRTFAFETTLATRFYANWIDGLRNNGYRLQLMFLWLRSPDLAVLRVRERVRAGGHDVPEIVIRRRYVAGLRNFWLLYQPLADAWAVYDNSELNASIPVASGDRNVPLLIYDKKSWISFSLTKP